ncbi:hypothetical protein ACFX1R_036175 [Malus domestica]
MNQASGSAWLSRAQLGMNLASRQPGMARHVAWRNVAAPGRVPRPGIVKIDLITSECIKEQTKALPCV